jgi:hypothetical protein
MRAGTLRQAAEEHHVTYSRARHWARLSGFPAPVDDGRRPHLYDLDTVAEWATGRPGQGARTDLRTEP